MLDHGPLTQLIATCKDGVIFIDDSARILRFNPAAEEMFGYQEDEILGQRVNVLMPAPYSVEHDAYMERYERTGEARAIGRIRTVEALHVTGRVFPIELSVTELDGASDVRYAAFIRDISEKVELQEQLIDRERLAAVGALAAKLAHEVGNPLNNLMLHTQMMSRNIQRRTPSDEFLLSGFKTVMTEIARLNDLLHEFRSMSRGEVVKLESANIVQLVREVLAVESPRAAVGGIRVEPHLAQDLPEVMVDAPKFKQVLLNLFKNAVEAMPRGGVLKIVGRVEDEMLVLDICDTGEGIPEGVDVFEAFRTTKETGTGLGLAIAKQIMEGLRGSISYESEPGVGTTFTLSLPLPSSWPSKADPG